MTKTSGIDGRGNTIYDTKVRHKSFTYGSQLAFGGVLAFYHNLFNMLRGSPEEWQRQLSCCTYCSPSVELRNL